ncbi:hypothetical protein Hanom_Chr12g01138401 [Helianthus anomalus]
MNLNMKMLDHQPCVSKNCRMWSFILSTIKLFSLLNLNEQICFLNCYISLNILKDCLCVVSFFFRFELLIVFFVLCFAEEFHC